ncbi:MULTISPECIES: helix-turn-helix domain-containing protein [Nocardioides]|uniref:helix-turn-helix domain-containing protein n=1 Tax=Nocardioides TaxID=1839 RepID=UPI0011DF1D14|nr:MULTISPECIES: helix-turn-helix domain-containing protein [Nocardioides]MCM3516161.1 helix-turn-helix domain-containing protein [Nocardioides sp. P86]
MIDDSTHVSAADTTRRDLLTPAQLADRWHVSTGHLANLRHQGEGIGYVKIGSRVAYRYSDVIAYENQHYVSPVGSASWPATTA